MFPILSSGDYWPAVTETSPHLLYPLVVHYIQSIVTVTLYNIRAIFSATVVTKPFVDPWTLMHHLSLRLYTCWWWVCRTAGLKQMVEKEIQSQDKRGRLVARIESRNCWALRSLLDTWNNGKEVICHRSSHYSMIGQLPCWLTMTVSILATHVSSYLHTLRALWPS